MDKYLVAFSLVPGIGAARLKLLINFFGSSEKAWNASEIEIIQTGLPKGVVDEFLKTRNNLDIDKYIKSLYGRGIKFYTINDEKYPSQLRNIPDPPTVLFVRSNEEEPSRLLQTTPETIIGVVGTRKMTSYGREVTEQLVTGLVGAGFTIASGMALGVDGVAHGTTINLRGTTIAVLGAGVDVIYPREHADLYNKIIQSGGAIVSEVAPDKLVGKGIFPARNRIISGLSRAVLVTERALDSGRLITAKVALEQGREVFAVPGPINSAMAEGTNYLIKQGAKVVTSVNDILEGMGSETKVVSVGTKDRKSVKGDNVEEQIIIDLLQNENLDFDELVRKTKLGSGKLGGILSGMEIKKKIRESEGKYYLDD